VTRLEEAYQNKRYCLLGILLWNQFVMGEEDSHLYQLAQLIYEACTPKERALMEN